ncbi:hypothetical protein HPB48_013370 [Haemaphysalis longicornis]|uniref:Uncharacterized protein n=1 Tax=Haemaphysalis longicornis TaxID=44386 RepID=A0A9J6FRB2_HAELO|nr:hypothetical protein HPB48_013370 [Haemaphysalis longicornis]
MNAARAIRFLSPSEHLKDQARHTCSVPLSTTGPTITFTSNLYSWFVLHNTRNTIQQSSRISLMLATMTTLKMPGKPLFQCVWMS